MKHRELIDAVIFLSLLAVSHSLNTEMLSPVAEGSRKTFKNQTFTLDEAHRKCGEYLTTTLAEFLQKVPKTPNNDGTAKLGQKVEAKLNEKINSLMGKCDPTKIGVAQFVSTTVEPKENSLNVEQLVIQKIYLTPHLREVKKTTDLKDGKNCTNNAATSTDKPGTGSTGRTNADLEDCLKDKADLSIDWEEKRQKLEATSNLLKEHVIEVGRLKAQNEALIRRLNSSNGNEEVQIKEDTTEIKRLNEIIVVKDVEINRLSLEKITIIEKYSVEITRLQELLRNSDKTSLVEAEKLKFELEHNAKVIDEIQNENARKMSSSEKSLDECKTNLTQIKESLNFCQFENVYVGSLVSSYYEETNSSQKNEEYWQPIFGSNATTKEMLEALHGECKGTRGKLVLNKNEIKNAKEFVQVNLTSLVPLVGLNSTFQWNDNETIVEILKEVHDKLETEIGKMLNESKNFMQELSTDLKMTKDNLNLCRLENTNIATLVSLQYQERISKNKNYGNQRQNLESNGTTTEILNFLQGECSWLEEKLISAKDEIEKTKNFIKINLIAIDPLVDMKSSELWIGNDSTVEILQKVHGELQNEIAKIMNLSNQSLNECKKNLTQIQEDTKEDTNEIKRLNEIIVVKDVEINRLNLEKITIIEKHSVEITRLQVQIKEDTTEIKRFNEIIVVKDVEINRLNLEKITIIEKHSVEITRLQELLRNSDKTSLVEAEKLKFELEHNAKLNCDTEKANQKTQIDNLNNQLTQANALKSELDHVMTDRDKLKSELSVKDTFIKNLLINDLRCFEERVSGSLFVN